MSRDKQIEEMARSLCLLKNDTCEDCNMKEHCLMRNCAECFYNAGYRKSTKLAEEIFAEIEASAKVKYWRGGGLVVFEVNGEDFAELKKKYTKSEKDDEVR